MNKDNFKKLIDAIKLDGQFRFNMSCFVGKLTLNSDEYQRLIKEDGELASEYEPNALHTVNTTEMFNCDSVGCIAGFATALVNDWKTPKFLESEQNTAAIDYGIIINSFENSSNKFLGLNERQGRKLYYGDSNSVWKYLRYYESDQYPELRYGGEDDGEADEIVEGNRRWDDPDYDIDYSSIDYLTAAHVLTRIMNGEIVLDEFSNEIEILAPADVRR